MTEIPDLSNLFSDTPQEPDPEHAEQTQEQEQTREPEQTQKQEQTQEPEQTQDQEGKSQTDQFADLLSKYGSPQEAKKHFTEIALKLGCSTALGYKALKRVKKWNKEGKSAKVPTFKIESAEIEAAPTEEETPIYTPYEEPQTQQQKEAPFQYVPSTGSQDNITFDPDTLGTIFGRGLWNGLATLVGTPEGKLSDAAIKRLGNHLVPVAEKHFPKFLKEPENMGLLGVVFELTPVAPLVLPAAGKKIWNFLEGRNKKIDTLSDLIKTDPEPIPQPEPKQEPKPEAPQEQKPENPTNVFNDSRPKWEKQLK